MYNLKPIINQDMMIDRPICMYEMKNIHDDGDSKQKCRIVSEVTGHFINSLKTPLAEVAALEARQEKILIQLAELKDQVLNLCNVLNLNNNQKSVSNRSVKKHRTAVYADLVLNVSPSKPCYSLLALEKLWTDVDFRISPFIHSTIKSEIPKEFKKIQPRSNKKSTIQLSLIWKEVLNTELITSGVQHLPVIGEINLLRYLVRMIDNDMYEKAESILEAMSIDKILDLSHQLIYQTPKDKQQTLILLNQILGSNTWFSNKNQFGISDIATWSAIKQCSFKKLPANLSPWYEKCDNLFLK